MIDEESYYIYIYMHTHARQDEFMLCLPSPMHPAETNVKKGKKMHSNVINRIGLENLIANVKKGK